jgi:hypothetical protein
MTKDEALRLALEALESTGENDGYHGLTQYFDEKMVDKAITAIKAALSGEAQTRSVVKDEPVAWWIPKHKAPDMVSKVRWSDECEPLYTTPPQRKPLTDEEIQEIVSDASRAGTLSWTGYKEDDEGKYTIPVLSPSDYQFARAIEAAHGIKGEA